MYSEIVATKKSQSFHIDAEKIVNYSQSNLADHERARHHTKVPTIKFQDRSTHENDASTRYEVL